MTHIVIPDTDCILASPSDVSAQGVLDEAIGIATLGWLTLVPFETPIIVVPPPDNIGSSSGVIPNKDWWAREDAQDTWFGPMSYRDANLYARRMSNDPNRDGVVTAQLGTWVGSRGGDPIKDPDILFVVFLYVNGKMTLGGRVAEYNSDKY